MSLIDTLQVILLFALLGVIAALLQKLLRLPLSLILVGCGFAFSFSLGTLNIDTGIRAHNFRDLVFFVFLPVLVFEAAYAIDQQQLRKQLLPILLLAIFGLLLATIITAVGVYFGIGYGFPLAAALLTGAMLSATDPVAVVDQLKRLNAPKPLSVLIEGESLFNDATAIVLFSILLTVALNDANAVNGGQAVWQFLLTFGGGILVGLVVGLLAVFVGRLLGEALPLAFVSLLAAYGSFYLAEHVLHVSGVMAVLVTGLLFGWQQQRQADPAVDKIMMHVWEFLAYGFNLLIFVVMGLVITVEMFTERWLAMLIAIAAVMIARLVSVYLSTGLSGLLQRQSIDRRYPPVLVWGGLRGAIAIALVLSLPIELEFWWTIQSMVFGVVLFSLLVQAPTMNALLRRLQLVNK